MPEVCNAEFRFGNAMGGTCHTHWETGNMWLKNRPENEWAGLVTRTGKQELCDTQFLFENASEILEVCQVVEWNSLYRSRVWQYAEYWSDMTFALGISCWFFGLRYGLSLDHLKLRMLSPCAIYALEPRHCVLGFRSSREVAQQHITCMWSRTACTEATPACPRWPGFIVIFASSTSLALCYPRILQ